MNSFGSQESPSAALKLQFALPKSNGGGALLLPGFSRAVAARAVASSRTVTSSIVAVIVITLLVVGVALPVVGVATG